MNESALKMLEAGEFRVRISGPMLPRRSFSDSVEALGAIDMASGGSTRHENIVLPDVLGGRLRSRLSGHTPSTLRCCTGLVCPFDICLALKLQFIPTKGNISNK